MIIRIDLLSASECLVHEVRPLSFDPREFERKLDVMSAMLRSSQRRLALVSLSEKGVRFREAGQ